MSDLSPNISIITLNVNGPNTPIKSDWQSRYKIMIQLYAIYNKLTSYICNDIGRFKVKG